METHVWVAPQAPGVTRGHTVQKRPTLDALTIQRVTLLDIPLWIADGSCEVLPKPACLTIFSVLEGSRMSRQDVPSSLRKWVLVRHMHKSLVQLSNFFPNVRLPWHQESCSTQDLQQARPTVEASTSLQLKPVRTPVAILGSLGVCIYVPASRHWLISYSPIHLT